MATPLPVIDGKNPKDIIIAGLEFKLQELATVLGGPLAAPFEIIKEYPSKATYDEDIANHKYNVRRIVVKKLENSVDPYAVGHVYDGELDPDATELEETLSQGWVDFHTMEISVWSPDSKDRDNIVELTKLWMLELEQKPFDNRIPFFLDKGVEAVRFIRAYESIDRHVFQNGVMYIGSLVYQMHIPMRWDTSEEFERYKIRLITQINEDFLLKNTLSVVPSNHQEFAPESLGEVTTYDDPSVQN